MIPVAPVSVEETPDQHSRQVRIARVVLQRRLAPLPGNEIAREIRSRATTVQDLHALALHLAHKPEAVPRRQSSEVTEVAACYRHIRRRVDVEDRVNMPRPTPLRFPRSHRERQEAPHVALARIAGRIV